MGWGVGVFGGRKGLTWSCPPPVKSDPIHSSALARSAGGKLAPFPCRLLPRRCTPACCFSLRPISVNQVYTSFVPLPRRCTVGFYCCTECQREDWAFHKVDCQKLAEEWAALQAERHR